MMKHPTLSKQLYQSVNAKFNIKNDELISINIIISIIFPVNFSIFYTLCAGTRSGAVG
jgi:hypothetical protein